MAKGVIFLETAGHILNIKKPCFLVLKPNNPGSQYEKWIFYSNSSKHIALVGIFS
jgi:hypothetical protein